MFLRRLQADGLITSSRQSPTSKRSSFCLTSRGRKFFEELFPRHIERVMKLVPKFDEATFKKLRAIQGDLAK